MKIPITEFKQDYKKSWEYAVSQIYDYQKEIERLNKCIKDDKENADEIIVEQQREIERLNNIIEKLEQENAVLKTLVVNKDKYSYGIR